VKTDKKVLELFKEHEEWFYRLCKRIAYAKCWDKEECIQEGYFGFVHAAKRYKKINGAHFCTYAEWRIRGAIIDFYRKQRQFHSQKSKEYETDWTEKFDINLHGYYYTDSHEHPFSDFADLLPDMYKIVLNLFYLEGFNKKEIADELGLAPATIDYRFNRAIAYLQDTLLDGPKQIRYFHTDTMFHK